MAAATSQEKAKKSKKTKQKENQMKENIKQKTSTHVYREHKGRTFFIYKIV